MYTKKDPPDWRQFFRVLPIIFGRDRPLRRRHLAQEAARIPTGLGALSLAEDLWATGDIAAAYRLAEKAVQARPDNFEMLLICLSYHVRARDSKQIYVFAERLIAAKNPARQLRLIYAVESLFLWPLWLLGSRFGRNIKRYADNLDRWVAWANNYLASHPKPMVGVGDLIKGEHPPADITAGEIGGIKVRKETSSVVAFLLGMVLLFLIALFVYGIALFARRISKNTGGYAAIVRPVEPSGALRRAASHSDRGIA